ncbi:MAG TPA: TAXI family TRAP transporter solute-binding subunit [Alphaproteobacteria bacterium]|jgi:TRAP transporter TAXI family solute receptor
MTLSRRDFARIAAAGAASAALGAEALADFGDKGPITATVTGATPTGYPRTMVEGLNAVVRDAYPGSSISFKPNSPGGGVVAVSKGEADFTATATGAEIGLANEGKFPFREPLKGKFQFVMQLYDNAYIHLLMTKAWADENGIRSWDDIAKKRPRMRLTLNRPDNPQGSIGGPYELMKAHGFTIDDVPKWGGSFVLGNSSVSIDAIKDGKADVMMSGGILGNSLVKDTARTRDLLWIDGDLAKLQKAADAFHFKAEMVPKGTYAFMDKDYPTIRMWVAMLAGAHVPEQVVYKYTKAIAEAEARVQALGGVMKTGFATAKMATNASGLPYHPGALRYYKEKGMAK